ncbi:MAG: hypothetical protein FJ387_21255 [Verrucomicrobia bacterium]|nr:hypothetical protein [Verrucomicrobiota bacterium]
MKPCLLSMLFWLASTALATLAQTSTPHLLGIAVPAAEAVPAPETVLLDALANSGDGLVLTSTSDRLTTNDLNAAADVFLFGRPTARATLVSARTNGWSGNGSSLGGSLAADGSRVAFLSRASDLAGPDTNHTWDVFVYDVATGVTTIASLAADGGSSAGPASDPILSADGRYVVFGSPARDLAPDPSLGGYNLYRSDLVEHRTDCLTTGLPLDPQVAWRLTGWAVTPDAQASVLTLDAVAGTPSSSAVVWRNHATRQSVDCSASLPPELVSSQPVAHTAPAVSADGRFVAFHSEMKVSAVYRHALCLHDLGRHTTTILSLRTNDTARQTFPSSAHAATLDTDGQHVLYLAPLPAYDPSASVLTNGPMQVYLYHAPTRTPRLVSAAPDGVTPANADAGDARLTPDGRVVFFSSRATNLTQAAVAPGPRLYRWDRDSGELHVVTELSEGVPPGPFVMSPNGEWIAALGADAQGQPVIRYAETMGGVASDARLAPAVTQSATGRGWVGVQPAGVSADGRYVALTAFPPGPAGDSKPMQVYRHDTLTGTRQLITSGVDGHLANSHALPPSLSADGAKLLLFSAATNLVPADLNAVADLFVHAVSTGERAMLRGTPLPIGAAAQPASLISPDGAAAFLTFLEGTKWVSRLADVPSGALAASFSGTPVGLPSFSRTGQKLAVSLSSSTPSAAYARVEVHDVAAWLAGNRTPHPALWTSSLQAVEPLLSADGNRVAYFHLTTIGTNAVLVVDWAKKRLLFSRGLGSQAPSSLSLSANGRFVSWISRGAEPTSPSQVWRGDLDHGTVALASVALDGAGEGNAASKTATLSADGRYVAFSSLADNLVAADTNGAKDVFLRDMLTGRTLLLSRAASGLAGSGWSVDPFFSADGRSLFFVSHAPNLALDDYNQTGDLFKVEILGDPTLLAVLERNLNTGQGRLLWNGVPGRSYRIEFKDDLNAAGWSTVPGVFAADGQMGVDTRANPQRFYRVVEQG